jgi:hypothetical protein
MKTLITGASGGKHRYCGPALAGLSWLRQGDAPVTTTCALQRKLDWLWAGHHVFACTCSRRDVIDALGAPQKNELPTGPDGVITGLVAIIRQYLRTDTHPRT